MIITRRLARHVRRVFSQALDLRRSGHAPLTLEAGPDGLVLRAQSPEVAIEYRLEGAYSPQQFAFPLAALNACAGARPTPVTIEQQNDHTALLRWLDEDVPQVVPVELLETAQEFPAAPTHWSANPARLLPALAAASECTDRASRRYALGCLQLSGARGRIAATDGRQLLVQSGFTFPWEEALLVPASRAFACPELAAPGEDVLLAQQENWIVLRHGPWTLYLALVPEARFPDVDRVIPSRSSATTLTLDMNDSTFLAKTLPRLPAACELNAPITLDLNGSVLLRARDSAHGQTTELALQNSTWHGDALRLATNRAYLSRAVRLGFHEFSISGATAPILCQDEHRQYLWATLGQEGAIAPSPDALRLESPPLHRPPRHVPRPSYARQALSA